MAKKKPLRKTPLHRWFNSVNKPDAFGLTKLYRAARHGNTGLVKKLLAKGADPDIPTECGLHPLHIAAFWGEVEIVRLLLDHGANPNVVTHCGWTPLHSASLSAGLEGRRRVIELLIQHSADSGVIDKHGWTPRDYAALWKDPDNPRLKAILEHLHNDKTELTGHRPDLKKLGLCKRNSPPGPPAPPRHH